MSENGVQGTCCPSKQNASKKKRPDLIYAFSLFALCTAIIGNIVMEFMGVHIHALHHFSHAALGIFYDMWWGIAIGIVMVGVMTKIPRDFFTAIMGRDNTFGGLVRAIFGGLFLDLCCHGILLVAAKLYERGISFAQVIAFLVASPWNSVSLTFILIGLIGLQWTLLYIAGSLLIALCTGAILQRLVHHGYFPQNSNMPETKDHEDFHFWPEFKALLKKTSITPKSILNIVVIGWREGQSIIKWLLFGIVIAASMRTFIPAEMFAQWLGPTLTGLFVTLIIATIVEICSEGSAPIAGEIVTGAHAPGNGFTFLMAGVATDYTEIAAIREFTGSWRMSFIIPMITVPQIIFIGWIMNMAV